MVNLSTASVPKPAVPQFTVQYTNGTVQVVIKNQQYTFSMGEINYHVYYNVRVDPHFGLGWKERYPLKNGTTGPNSPFFEYVNDPENSIQSNSENTIITFYLDDTSYVSSEGKNDFQVKAIVGHDSHIWTATHVFFPEYGGYTEYAVACDATSGWSDTVTLNLNDNTSTNQIPASQGQPTAYQIDFMAIGLLVTLCVIAVLLAIIALMYRKQTKNMPVQSP
jgi:hypothetical protein